MNTTNLKAFQLWSLVVIALAAIVALLTGCDNYKAPQQNIVPALTSISPASAVAGGAAFTLTANGTGFLASSVVNWNGSPRPTTYVNASRLSVAIPASDIAAAGAAPVTVSNPTPGGGSSAAVNFTITSANNPSPTISSLSPPASQPAPPPSRSPLTARTTSVHPSSAGMVRRESPPMSALRRLPLPSPPPTSPPQELRKSPS